MCDLGIYGGWLTVNRFCNMRCAWCYAAGAAFKPEDNMPLDMAYRLVDLMHAVGIKNIVLIGGETLFWPHLFEIASYIKSLGMTSTVATNGWLLGFKRFRDRIEKSDISSIGISLKAGNRQQYIELAGYDGYNKVMEGLHEVGRWEHIRVETSMVLTTGVMGNFTEVVKTAFENSGSFINIQMCEPGISNGQFDGRFMPNAREVARATIANYNAVNAITDGRFSLELMLPACLWPAEFLRTLEERGQVSYGCHFKTRSGLVFDRWGQLLACNHLYDYPLGQYGVDFVDRNSFAAHWNKSELTAFYDRMLEFPAKACIQCLQYNKCGGGCPLQWFVRDPEATIPSHEEVCHE